MHRSIEDHFSPGLKTQKHLFIGSQSSQFIHGIPEEQAWEGFYLGAAHESDIVVVRDFEPEYLEYWKELMGNVTIINLMGTDKGQFLTQVILNDDSVIRELKQILTPETKLMVFFPTPLEDQLAQKLGIGMHGIAEFSGKYGSKSGMRRLAMKHDLRMAPGFICTTKDEITEAVRTLEEQHFDTIILKHDDSFSGYFSKKVHRRDFHNVSLYADEIANGKFTQGKDVVVVEGWLQSNASLCAHIEIIEGESPIVCAGWQQVIDSDGITYMGAGPLTLSDTALQSFLESANQIAQTLKQEGAIGSFGPDFLITSEEETHFPPDTAVLIELNARIPYTAVPLEIIKKVRGKIGHGFYSRHVYVTPGTTIREILTRLTDAGVLIQKKGEGVSGVVPYNVGLLPWNVFDLVAMGETWDDANENMTKALAVLPLKDR